ncbi:MFS transporter [Streptomyces noursei]|uniref:MFS transporter n=1 Tax=Streptomyces noursei TaxID=1971 RepID=UPI0034089A22
MGATGHAPGSPGRPLRGQGLWAASLGGIVESFDWSIYVLLVPYFSGQVIAEGTAGRLISYAGFTIGFVVRPLGSVLLGRFSDRRGRRAGMLLSMTVVAAGSVALALLPTAGCMRTAAVLLFVVRIVQGLAVGSEHATVAAYVTETAPPRHRLLYSGVSYCGVIFGNVLCYLVLAILLAWLGPQGMYQGGWRAGFAVGGLLGLMAVLVRRWAFESPEFLAHRSRKPASIAGATNRAWGTDVRRNATAVFLMTAGLTSGYYLTIAYLPEYVRHSGGTVDTQSTAAMVAPLLVLLAAMTATGALADVGGARQVFRAGMLLTALVTGPAYATISSRLFAPWIAAAVILTCLAGPLATAHVFFASLFPVHVRVVAMGLPLTTSTAFFGGTFPLLAEALTDAGHVSMIPWCASAASVLSLAATWLVREAPTHTPRHRTL